jgi:spore coat protein CotH
LAGNRAGLDGKSQNNLLSRFLENTSFKALYEEKLAKVYQAIYLNGAIAEDVDRYQVLIHEVNKERSLVDSDTYDLAVGKVKSFITQRIEAWNNSQPATGN